MNNRAYALLTGLFLIVLIAGVIGAAVWMGGSHESTRPFVVVTTEDVSGLQPQSPIYYRGIAAGSVGHIRLDPQDPRNILIEVNVDTEVPVTQGTFAKLKLQGITGQSFLELDYDTDQGNAPLQTDAHAPAHIPMRRSLLDTLSGSSAQLMLQLQKLAESLNQMLGPDNQTHVKHLLAQADAATEKLTELETDLDVTARKLPELNSQTQSAFAAVQQAADNINNLGKTLNHELANGSQSKGTLQQLDETLGQINQAAADIHRLAQNLATDPQRLLYGPTKPAPGPGEPGYKEPQP